MTAPLLAIIAGLIALAIVQAWDRRCVARELEQALRRERIDA